MQTLGQGLLSGLFHPVLGLDHLFFVVAVGLAAGTLGRWQSAPLAYVVTMVLGCIAAVQSGALFGQEVMVALSLLVMGGAVAFGRITPRVVWVLFAGFGLFHGSAFAGALAGAEAGAGTGVLIGYLGGLALVQYVIAAAIGAWATTAARVPLAGAAVAGVGAFLMLEMVEGPAMSLIAG